MRPYANPNPFIRFYNPLANCIRVESPPLYPNIDAFDRHKCR